MPEKYDVVVLGAGPGGYVAALRAVQLGARVTLVEEREVGGTCLQRGCIPSKALLSSAELFHKIKHQAKSFGITVSSPQLDLGEVLRRKNKVVRQLTLGLQSLLKHRNIEVIYGHGRFHSSSQVEIEMKDGTKTLIESPRMIIASGSEPLRPTFLPFDGKTVITSDQALEIKTVPASCFIVGAGAVGCEFATFLARVGSRVTLIEKLAQVLPGEDPESSAFLEKALTGQGVMVKTSMALEGVEVQGDRVKVSLNNGEKFTVDLVLGAIGRSLNTRDLGLEAAGIQVDKGHIVVNAKMETNVFGIYAVGDVTGRSLLAHSAFAQGRIAAENALGHAAEYSDLEVPHCIYSAPEVASVGFTESTAKEHGIAFSVGRFPFSASGKALIEGETTGQVKVLAHSKTHEILGVHIVGAHATELIHEGVLAIKMRTKVEILEEMIHAHPTLSEAMGEAVHVLVGRPLHLF